ncbi:MAG: hypothetical protein ACRDRL_33850, partial [Sciscionella sp.]
MQTKQIVLGVLVSSAAVVIAACSAGAGTSDQAARLAAQAQHQGQHQAARRSAVATTTAPRTT